MQHMGETESDGLGEQLVRAIEAASGVFPGHRTLHAKGAPALGAFTSSGDAITLTTAAHLQPGATTPVEVRFSNGSADPTQADGVRDGRGLSVKFRLPDGTATDIVSLSLPVFFVRTVPDFLAFLVARTPDPKTGEMDMNKVFAFLGEHPEAARAAELSVTSPTPASFAQVRYFGVHCFWMVAADGTRTKVKYRWEPAAGEAGLTSEQAVSAEPGYLATEIAERLNEGPVSFTLHLIVGTEEDDEADPTTEWPADRNEVVAGTLVLNAQPEDPADIDKLIFDPVRVTPGIETSVDEILHARSAAYSASYSRRTS